MANVTAAGVSTVGITVSYCTTSSGTYTTLYSISRIPELEGAPELLDVTPLSADNRIYTPGVKDNSLLEFEGWKGKYGVGGTLTDEYTALRALSGSTAYYWKIEYPDGSKNEFQGYPSARDAGAEVNNGLGYILSIVPASGVTYTGPAGA